MRRHNHPYLPIFPSKSSLLNVCASFEQSSGSDQREDSEAATSYSGASTSRLVSTPVENSASSSSEEVVKGVKHASSQEQVQRQAELSETTVQSVLQRAFRGLVRRQEVGSVHSCKSELIRRNVQTIPPASVSQTPKSEPMVYVEKDGFLSGLTVAEAVFAFNFADEELLLHGYRWMSLPVHVVFLVCFTIGCVAATDRTAFYGWSVTGIKKTLSHDGVIGIILWSIGLIASAACIRFDESIAPAVKDANLTPDLLLHWRICSAVRAVCASAAWLLLALRPNCDVLGETIKNEGSDQNDALARALFAVFSQVVLLANSSQRNGPTQQRSSGGNTRRFQKRTCENARRSAVNDQKEAPFETS
ncbi:hypothetical protein RB195_001706 [Necator americanus]|uniref:Transmembrane protein n=1 Tax=Necator americanus TaxID=51031 RepID=A0ABR1DFK2_NECAM